MLHHLRIVRLFWGTAIAAEMEYRVNFVIAALTASMQMVLNIFGLWLFYRTGYQPGGWTWHEALLVQGVFTLLEGVSQTWLSPNIGRIVTQVQTGTLDFVLLKPIDSQFWVSTRNMSPWGLPDLLLGAATILYAAIALGLPWHRVLLGIVPIALSIAILFGLWFILACTAVWFVKIYNITEVLRSFLEAGKFPVQAYPPAYRFVFTFILPVAFLTTVPAQTMLDRSTPGWILGAALVAVALLAFGRWFWRFAMRYYTSASS